MKKLLIFALLAMVFAACERNRNDDYLCPRDFEVKNETEQVLVYVDPLSGKSLAIAPYETKIIFDRGVGCLKGEGYSDLFLSDESVVVSPQKHILSIGGESLSEDVWLRRHWKFSAKGDRFPTYTLVVTDELIEALSQPTETGGAKTRASAAYIVNPNNPYSLSVVQRALNTTFGASAWQP